MDDKFWEDSYKWMQVSVITKKPKKDKAEKCSLALFSLNMHNTFIKSYDSFKFAPRKNHSFFQPGQLDSRWGTRDMVQVVVPGPRWQVYEVPRWPNRSGIPERIPKTKAWFNEV